MSGTQPLVLNESLPSSSLQDTASIDVPSSAKNFKVV